jgi:hypothetical protein
MVGQINHYVSSMENRKCHYDACASLYYRGCENKVAGKSDESGFINFLKQLQQKSWNRLVRLTVSPVFTFTVLPLTHRQVTESNELFISSVKSN